MGVADFTQQPRITSHHAECAPGLAVPVPQAETFAAAVKGKSGVKRTEHRLDVLMKGEVDVIALRQCDDDMLLVVERFLLSPA